MRYTVMSLLAAFAIGCGGEDRPMSVPLGQVPEPAMKVAKEKLTDVRLEQAWKRPNGNYEIRGKDADGKVLDIVVKPTGEVVEGD